MRLWLYMVRGLQATLHVRMATVFCKACTVQNVQIRYWIYTFMSSTPCFFYYPANILFVNLLNRTTFFFSSFFLFSICYSVVKLEFYILWLYYILLKIKIIQIWTFIPLRVLFSLLWFFCPREISLKHITKFL